MRITIIQIALFFAISINCQIPYFNIQFDNRQLGEKNGYKTLIETDSFYVTAGWSSGFYNPGAPHDCDTGIVVYLNKFDGISQLVKIPTISGIHSLVEENDSTLVFLFRINECLNSYDTNSYFGLGRIVNQVFDENSLKAFDVPKKIDVPLDLTKTLDGGFVITGYTFGLTEQGTLPILKCDSNFNQEFLKLIPPNPYSYFGASIKESPNHDFIIVGSHRAQSNDLSHGLILKIDKMGNVIYNKEIKATGDTTRFFLEDIIRKSDGTYIVVGTKRIDPVLWKRNDVGYRTCINESGTVLWSKQDSDDESDARGYTRIKESPDGNYLLSGYDRFYPKNFDDYPQFATISKMTPDGDILWRRRYTVEEPQAHYDIFQDVIPTSDGGILVVGTTYANDNDSTRQNIWMMKLDSLGCDKPGCDTITSVIILPIGKNSPLKIYPNPTNGLFSLETDANDLIEMVRIFDIDGKLRIDRKINKTNELELDISMYPSGQYFLSVLINNRIITRPLTKI